MTASERWLRMEATLRQSERARQEEVLDAVCKAHAREMYEALKRAETHFAQYVEMLGPIAKKSGERLADVRGILDRIEAEAE